MTMARLFLLLFAVVALARAQLEGFEDMDDDSKAEAIRKLMADRNGGGGGGGGFGGFGGGGGGGGGGMPSMMGQGGKEVPDDEKRDILEKVRARTPRERGARAPFLSRSRAPRAARALSLRRLSRARR